MPSARFGAHMMAPGGLHQGVLKGKEAGCDLIQIFTKSPQQWRARPITDEQVTAFLEAQEQTGVRCYAAHDTYLINPASDNPDLLQRSRDALLEEMERSTRLRIPYVVMHLGAAGKASEAEALQRLADSVAWVLERAPTGLDASTLLLETTAGQGTCLGHRFEHLAHVLEFADAGARLGVCLDTCHLFVAGYDLRDAAAYTETTRQFEATVGLDRVRVVHANDAKRELGSRVDRHENIGLGQLGTEAFRLLLTDARLAHAAVILETPKEGDMDPVNLAALRTAADSKDEGR
jgi:deoxyribonuclease-4